jgi:heme-degrading monooxygenase HmoA
MTVTVGEGAGTPFTTGQVMTIFRSRKRPEAEAAYVQTAEQMEAAARAMPGFVDFKVFVAEDGERVSLITFESPATQQAWRDHPRHRLAQQQGRDDFYLEYSIQVGACGYVSRWSRPSG